MPMIGGKFHMNPQMGKAMSGGSRQPGKMKNEENLEEKVSPGIHEKVSKLENYNGHEHNGQQLAHHVEIHHGGHEAGQPPAHAGTTHHTVHHRSAGSSGGGGGGGDMEHGHETAEAGGQDIRNHDSGEEATQSASDSMHIGCPECDQGSDGSEVADMSEGSTEGSDGNDQGE